MKRLLIARHGNTFGPGDIPTRVGARTDLPLVDSGLEQARRLGRYLKEHDLIPDAVYTSELQRTRQMAEIALQEVGLEIATQANPIFNEIDYGPDENQTEDKVIARLGEQALSDWDNSAVVPDGWQVDPHRIISDWQHFAQGIDDNKTVLVITSNGIARFAPYLTGEFDAFLQNYKIKISTGALCILEKDQGANWAVKGWNIKP